jgi:hypothetical protein
MNRSAEPEIGISVVVPVYRSSATLSTLVGRLHRFAAQSRSASSLGQDENSWGYTGEPMDIARTPMPKSQSIDEKC